MWQDDEDTQVLKLNSLEARVYCRKLRIANRKDWRVPKYDELLQLIEFTNYGPASHMGMNYFAITKYRTSSKDITNKNNYWYVDFTYGTTNTDHKSNEYNIRCVRDISKNKGSY